MMTLVQTYTLPLILAFIIGIATGWWMWAQMARNRVEAYSDGWAEGATAEPTGFDQSAPDGDAAVLEKALPLATAPVLAAAPAASVPLVAKPAQKPKTGDKPPVVKPRRARKEKAAALLTAIGIPAAIGPANDLLQIKGVGPKLNALLNRLGVTRFDQIAAWKTKEISLVDANLGAFQGRITRDNWVDQAGLLAMGKISTFEMRYGKLDSENQ